MLVYTPAGTPEERAEVHEVLGIAYRERLCGDRADNLEVAIACLKAALLVYTQADAPRQWATAQNNLGAIYCERVYTQDDTPQTWAMIQIDRGNTYRERLRGDRADNLEQAISCLEGALPILRLTDPAGALVALIAHGDACQELGRTEQLRAAWEEALTLREELLTAGTSTQTRGQVARRSQDLAGCGKTRRLEKIARKSARNRKSGPVKSMGYRNAEGHGLLRKQHRPTFSATC